MELQDKRRTTIYIDPTVLEFLSLRRIKGLGSVSQQLENLARQLMPREHEPDELRALEQRHRQGYEQHPVQEDEFAALMASQVTLDGPPENLANLTAGAQANSKPSKSSRRSQ